MNIIALIPARYESTRFPGKPLAMIFGKPMIQHVYERVKIVVDAVMVLTDDQRIFDVVSGFGGNVVMTSKECMNGTERCAEMVYKIYTGFADGKDAIIINVQGDQPFLDPNIIKVVIGMLKDPNTSIATLATNLNKDELTDLNRVKVVIRDDGTVHNFSRALIPGYENYKHIGIYAYRIDTLLEIAKLQENPREVSEKLEQLRWMYGGYRIRCAKIDTKIVTIDSPADLQNICRSENIINSIIDKESKAIKNIPYGENYERVIDLVHDRVHSHGGKLITTGVGKAGQIALNIATTFSSTGTPAVFLHPTEAQHGDLGIMQKNDIILAVSNSGNTREVIELIELANGMYGRVPVIVIGGNPKGEISRLTDEFLHTGSPEEVCPLGLAPTTSTTVMSVIGDILISMMMNKIGFTKEEYAKRHHGGYLGKKVKEQIKYIPGKRKAAE